MVWYIVYFDSWTGRYFNTGGSNIGRGGYVGCDGGDTARERDIVDDRFAGLISCSRSGVLLLLLLASGRLVEEASAHGWMLRRRMN